MAIWKHIVIPFLAALSVMLAALMPASADSPVDRLSIMTEDYPPFNFSKDNRLQGVSTEIMAEMLKRVDSKLGVADIRLLPWTRAYKLVQSEEDQALFSTTRTPSREYLFKWVGPFVPTVVGVIAKKERHLKIQSLSDLVTLRIGAVRDDIGHLLLQEINMPRSRIEPVLLNGQNYKKLIANRLDAIAYETSVSMYQLAEMGQKPSDYEVIYELQRSALYLALSIKTPDAIVRTLQDQLDAMKKDGTHAAILKKYRMSLK
ncbi:transporter substrate-binding domain-containing protein [Cohaesibacter sp. CAU 1516]|uniref:substrate-binding periplasmic protein n=1 Tax=Cohaesibacter sp. CAU 1516 TaxID=2576038 RepID=UPI001485010B|nr:transporter substrate-binding domain-containing protein [Cohaesibacter sp. CAU 1516]